ncbi:pilus assembly protein [Actinotalea sp. Marseille-Q4924]|uniref:pilus assembly protein n=1 Tax=Actinotalea sp. Marseille-Q4924 TaxID=2866571 RepID=UPI001CE461C6|nr:pilus assembly protein [Actinotalea sp. Marseille-Q4924]
MTGTVGRIRAWFRRWLVAAEGDRGSAVVEFLGVTVVLLVPLVYLVVVTAAVQAATFAVDGAAREAARAVVTADPDDAGPRAAAAVAIALEDQGLDPALAAGALTVRCEPDCLSPGTTLTVEVALDVALPGVPGFVRDAVPLAVPVSATITAPVDDYRSRERP